MNRDPFSIFSNPLDLPQTPATCLAPEPEPAPRGEPLRPERDPFELLLQLRPHYSDWLRIPADELHRSWRPGPDERLFV
ncbi:MAG TPA: hypothetical protein ENJ94_06975, partial [Gammaproteobacteria bacterium]|nr:hypothetical protein [Gammaproteobacteria bacterium]